MHSLSVGTIVRSAQAKINLFFIRHLSRRVSLAAVHKIMRPMQIVITPKRNFTAFAPRMQLFFVVTYKRHVRLYTYILHITHI